MNSNDERMPTYLFFRQEYLIFFILLSLRFFFLLNSILKLIKLKAVSENVKYFYV